ncbi:MAG: DUF1592 domain-containing protein [Planctomycetia bacterium]|nr:DUF1592 domain-containing protein [Planctomycetia bacterium]
MFWRLGLLPLASFVLLASVRTDAAPVAAFDKVGVAFLQKNCIACHNEKTKRADVSLHHLKTEGDLLKNRKLVENVLRVVRTGEMPPSSKQRPAVADLEAFTASVASVFESHDRTAKPDPGRVTVRRLNRAEYNNTIRDLVGVDFNPAADFPSDDIGHGFDNIGDVLTLSPVLMERYLAAAESIVQRAIMTTIPPVPRRYLAGRFLHPYPNDLPGTTGRFRPMRPLDPNPIYSGPFAAGTDYLKFTNEDDLILRVRLYAQPKGKSPVKVALFLSGTKVKNPSPDVEVDRLMGAGLKAIKPIEILKTFEITARDDKKLQEIEFPINRRDDAQRAGVAVIKPPEGEEPPHLFVENIWSEGPLETRPKTHRTLLACSPTKPQTEQTREVLGRFLSRAFRRPATGSETERYSKMVDQTVAAGQKWESGVQLAMQAALVSPKFLFRLELDERPGAEATALDEYQLASRLSYFLWSSMPDQELFELAARKQLVANLDSQVKRMLKDPRSGALTDNFAMQWLQLRRLKTHAPDAALFPKFDDNLRSSLLQETELFFDAIVKEDRSVLDLIDADFTFLNERLTWHYGITDTNGSTWGKKAKVPGKPIRGKEFVRVNLQPGDVRGGLLTQGSVLTVTSNPTRTSPVKRGKWVLEQLLGTPPPPPPPDVPELNEKSVLTGSLRQQMEQHRKNPACAACHAKMDPLGFAFENFDAVGAYRGQEGKLPIDASGELPDGRKFNGPAELKAILKEKKDLVARNLAEKVLTYALGRGLEYYDRRTVDGIVTAMAKNDYRFSTLITETVKSYPFRYRRGLEASK